MATVTRTGTGSTDSAIANCQSCLQRGRRGGNAVFPASRTADLYQWQARHNKHR